MDSSLMPGKAENLLVTEVDEETIVLKGKTAEVYCLDRTTGLVFRHCDGRSSITEVALLNELTSRTRSSAACRLTER